MHAQSKQPKVTVIGLGGTIAGVSESRVGFETYQPGKLPISKLVSDLQPEVGRVADVEPVDFGQKGSDAYTIADFYELSRKVDEELRDSDAVVISTGTQSMEELVYWLDLTVRSNKPVVVTGALRPWTVIGTDGQPNLYNAIRLAASKRTTKAGPVVMLNDQIIAAREVVKTDTLRVSSFGSREFGILGTVDEKGIRLLRIPAQPHTPFDLSRITADRLPDVEIVDTYLDAAGSPIKAVADGGAKGIVFAGTPSPQQAQAAMEAAKKGVALAAANSTGAGAVHVDPGSPVLSAADLSPRKTRLLLMLSLAFAENPEEIQTWFEKYAAPQF